MTTRAGEILRQAADIVDGPRNVQHGDKERSFAGIASLWNEYLDELSELGYGNFILQAKDVANMMVLLKIARSLYGTPVTDHFMDMAGYAAIAGELAEQKDAADPIPTPDKRSFSEWQAAEAQMTWPPSYKQWPPSAGQWPGAQG